MRDCLDRIVRHSHGRLLAFLAKRAGNDIALAEDALADAYSRALTRWPTSGVPDRPEAWLVRVAGHRIIDGQRRMRTQQTHWSELAQMTQKSTETRAEFSPVDQSTELLDERLQMMFACAHPAIDARIRTPLLLQAVLGMSVQRMASVFLVSPSTLSQRLVRAKNKIRDAGIRFEMPANLTSRTQGVLDAIYAAFTIEWDDRNDLKTSFADDAIDLVCIVTDRLPEHAEAAGLLALLLYCKSRDRASRDEAGRYVPLQEQSTALWDTDLIQRAEVELRRASRLGSPGRYQLEAAIQSAHVSQRTTGSASWEDIIQLHHALRSVTATIGVDVSLAAALAGSGAFESAMSTLDQIDQSRVQTHQPYWAVRAEVLRRLGDPNSVAAYDRAIGLSRAQSIRDHLRRRQLFAMESTDGDA